MDHIKALFPDLSERIESKLARISLESTSDVEIQNINSLNIISTYESPFIDFKAINEGEELLRKIKETLTNEKRENRTNVSKSDGGQSSSLESHSYEIDPKFFPKDLFKEQKKKTTRKKIVIDSSDEELIENKKNEQIKPETEKEAEDEAEEKTEEQGLQEEESEQSDFSSDDLKGHTSESSIEGDDEPVI